MIGSWFGKSLETVLKNNLSFAGEILMNIEQNSVKYDAAKNQITVTTYYDKDSYFANCIKKLLWHREKPLPNKRKKPLLIRITLLYIAIEAVRAGVTFLVLLSERVFSASVLNYMILYFLFILFYDKIEYKILNALYVFNARHPALLPSIYISKYAAGVSSKFAEARVFKQEVFISPSWATATPIFPDKRNTILEKPRQREIKITKNDIYFFTYQFVLGKAKQVSFELFLDESFHFNRKFYTEKDWKTLIEAMNEMQY